MWLFRIETLLANMQFVGNGNGFFRARQPGAYAQPSIACLGQGIEKGGAVSRQDPLLEGKLARKSYAMNRHCRKPKSIIISRMNESVHNPSRSRRLRIFARIKKAGNTTSR